MSLNARSIALQGIGFGALAVAMHGVVDVQPTVQTAPNAYYSTGEIASRAHWQQLHEEDEILMTLLQHFVMEA